MADVNWFLATVAQSSAALVAIVGGFLISRVIGLAADRDSMRRQLGTIRAELVERKETAEHLMNRLARQYAVDVLWESPELILDVELDDLPEAARAASGPQGDEVIEAVVNFAEQARDLVTQWSPRFVDGEPAPSLDDLERETDAPYAVSSEVHRRLKAHHRPPAPRKIVGMNIDVPAEFTVPKISPPERTRADYIAELERRIEDVQAERRLLAAREDHLGDELNALRVPAEFGQGLWVLAWLTLFGVVVPVCFMVGGPTILPLWLRILIATPAASGLLALVAFIAKVAESIKAESG